MMKILTGFILSASIALCAQGQGVKLKSSNGEIINKRNNKATLGVRMTFPMEKPAVLAYMTTRDTKKNTYSAHPHTHLGFNSWGNMTYIYPLYRKYNQWGPPDYVWTNKRKDGSTVTQIVIPVVDPKKDNKKAGSYSVRIVQLPRFKEWLFLRTTFEGIMPVRNEYIFAGMWTAFSDKYAARQGATRFGYVAGKHYISCGLEKIPANLEFDGFAVYAVNSVVHDKDLNIMVFNPEQFARTNFNFYYWVKGFRLDVLPKKESPVLTVACALFITDTPKEDAEKFFTEGKDKAVREAMANLNWEPEIDPSIAKAQLDKAAETVKTVTNATQKKSLEDLSAALKKAQAEKDDNNYFKTLDALKKLNYELTLSSLDSMLDD